MKTALLIPIYQPNEKVIPFLYSFNKEDFDYFLVVDDGSGREYQNKFDLIKSETCFDVLSYPINHGKGYALKTGMKKLIEEYPDLDFIVTADGDGQHLKKDILNIKSQLNNHPNELVLGTRDFSLPNVPPKSKKGNRWSCFFFKMFTGKKIKDTQTGLRAIPHNLFSLALSSEGNRYEYENNFLMDAVKETGVVEIDIETVYENNNEGTHFRPFVDSLRIAKKPILYCLVAISSSLLDLGIFSLMVYCLFNEQTELYTAISTVSARIISGIFNFVMLRYVVFKGKLNTWLSALKYLALFLINMCVSAAITALFTSTGKNLTVLKIIIDTLIFIINYFVNRFFVFAKKAKNKRRKKGESK